ncbi:MAG: hypothetical protein Q7V58_15965 [Actinomycetota bacterium]|nr:hypothetical protein [Actinomycetota bacterium]
MTRSPMARPRTRRQAAAALLVPAAALLLVGCGSIQEAVDGAQGAVDAAQSLMGAPERIGQACDTAVAALAPGQPAGEARAALDEATAQLDAALGAAAGLPGISDLREAFVSAGAALSSGVDATATEASRAALAAACAAFPRP